MFLTMTAISWQNEVEDENNGAVYTFGLKVRILTVGGHQKRVFFQSLGRVR